MRISVVATLFRSEQLLPEFYRRMTAALGRLGGDYELILVNDGSPDASLRVAVDLSRDDPRVRVIDLARNFGHHAAIRVGLIESAGDFVFLIDSDLEEAPENLVDFWSDLQSPDAYDCVYGIWRRQNEPMMRHISASSYYTLVNWLGDTPIPRNSLLSRLMTRRFVDAALKSWSIGAPPVHVMTSIGFKQKAREIARTYKGSTAYTVSKRLRVAVNAITGFSVRPLHYIFAIGLCVVALAVLMSAWAFVGYVIFHHPVAGWYSVFVSIWFIGGLTMLSMGILGLYIARIFEQVKGKPIAIVRARYRSGQADVSVFEPR